MNNDGVSWSQFFGDLKGGEDIYAVDDDGKYKRGRRAMGGELEKNDWGGVITIGGDGAEGERIN